MHFLPITVLFNDSGLSSELCMHQPQVFSFAESWHGQPRRRARHPLPARFAGRTPVRGGKETCSRSLPVTSRAVWLRRVPLPQHLLQTARAEPPRNRLHGPAPKRAPWHLDSMCCRVSQGKAVPQGHNTAPLPQSTGMPWDSASTTSARQPQAAAGTVTAASASTGAVPELLQKSETVKCLIKYVPPIARALQQP